MFYFFVSPSHQQAVNPCVALKLPLCRVKQEFAEEHGIRTEKPKPKPPIQRINKPNSFNREGIFLNHFFCICTEIILMTAKS